MYKYSQSYGWQVTFKTDPDKKAARKVQEEKEIQAQGLADANLQLATRLAAAEAAEVAAAEAEAARIAAEEKSAQLKAEKEEVMAVMVLTSPFTWLPKQRTSHSSHTALKPSKTGSQVIGEPGERQPV